MIAVERQQAILDLLDKKHTIQVVDLVVLFDVSEMTIRRDLDILERKGLLRRVQGGAISNCRRSYEPPFMLRSSANVVPRERIGKAADRIIVDAGIELEIAEEIEAIGLDLIEV